MLNLDCIVYKSHASSITNKPQTSHVSTLWFYIKQTNAPKILFKLNADKHQKKQMAYSTAKWIHLEGGLMGFHCVTGEAKILNK